jgi:hypothetical protein
MVLRALALAVSALCLAACGDAQLNEQYRGDPIFSIEGQLTLSGTVAQGLGSLRLAMFYSPEDENQLDPERWVEHLGSARPVEVPSLYTMNIFDPPGEEHMLRLPDGQSAGYAVGRLLVYSDDNQSGVRDPGEGYVGIAPPVGFYYVPEALPAERTGTRAALPVGFSKGILPQPCGYVPPPTTDPGSCGVPLGQRCNVDAECTGGLCLKETKMPWRAGYCIVPDPPPNGCRPATAVYTRAPRYSLTPPSTKQGFYLRQCQSNTDCERPDRDAGLYHCDPGLWACVPLNTSVLIPVGARFEVEPFCAIPP